MAQSCRVCQKAKSVQLFAAVPLCAACDAALAREALTRVPLIRAALRPQGVAAEPASLLAQCDQALKHAEALHRFERLGLPTTSPAPSQLLRELRTRRTALLQATCAPTADPPARREAYAVAA
jgi:hypothetical protein